jgi:hypothetical protein
MTTRPEPWSGTARLTGAGLALIGLLAAGAVAAHPGGGGGGGGGHASGGAHAGGAAHGGGGFGAGSHYGAAPARHGAYGYSQPHAASGATGYYGGAGGSHAGYSGSRGGYSGGHAAYAGSHAAYAGGHAGYAGGHAANHGGHGAYYGGHGGYYAPSSHYYAGYGGHGHYGGYYGGWHSAWYGGSWYWWGGVYPIGLYFAALPLYYQTFWWGGMPYYYADYTFYRWNDGVRQYEVVEPPAEASDGAPPAAASEPYVYPRQGQSDEQLKQDRFQCYRWAADQTGFDPTRANGGASEHDAPTQAGAYRRAEGACLEGRGYTVR